MDDRSSFLLKMYDQLWSNINRHILILWQSISVLIGTFTVFYLAEKQIISIDIACGLIILISAWQISHVIDSSHWVDRNLVIITNIEQQFLCHQDLKEIHYYFAKKRSPSMLDTFKIQLCLGYGIIFIVLLYHSELRIIPGFNSSFDNIELMRGVPYLLFLVTQIFIFKQDKINRKHYDTLLTRSPGRTK